METVFCDKCGSRVSEKEVASGRCTSTGSGMLCPICTKTDGPALAAAAPPAASAASGEEPRKSKGSGSAMRIKAARRRAQEAKGKAPAPTPNRESAIGSISVVEAEEGDEVAPAGGGFPKVYLAIPAAIVVAVAAAVLVFMPAEPEVETVPAVTAAPAPAITGPGKELFEAAVSFGEVNEGRSQELIALYQKVVDEFPESNYAKEATKRIAKLELAIPKEVYAALGETVRALTDEQKYIDAIKAIDAYLAEFPEPGEEILADAKKSKEKLAEMAVSDADLALARAKSAAARGDYDAAEVEFKALEEAGIEKINELVAAAREEIVAAKKKVEEELAAKAAFEEEAPKGFTELETAWARRQYDDLEDMIDGYTEKYSKTDFYGTKKKVIERMEKDIAEYRDIKAKEGEIITDGSRVEIYYRRDWDDGQERGWGGGKVVDDPGRGKVYQLIRKPDKWKDGGMRSHWNPTIPIARDGYLSFSYYLSQPLKKSPRLNMSNGNKEHNGFGKNLTGKYALEVGRWSFFAISLEDFASGRVKNFADGDMCKALSFSFPLESIDEGTIFKIDEVTITKGGYPTLIKAQIERAKKHRIEMTASAVQEPWFELSPDICRLLSQQKRDGVKPKTVMRAGSGIAATGSFIGPLHLKYKADAGYKFLPHLGTASRGKGVDVMKPKIIKAVERLKPEVVFVAFGISDVLAGRTASQLEASYAEIVKKIMEAGGVPVLVTTPVQRLTDHKANGEVSKFNTMVLKTANSLKVPSINAQGMLSSEELLKKKPFSGTGTSMRGNKYINDAAAELYRRLEKYVFYRGPKEPPLKVPRAVERPERRPARRDPVDDDDDDEPDTPTRPGGPIIRR